MEHGLPGLQALSGVDGDGTHHARRGSLKHQGAAGRQFVALLSEALPRTFQLRIFGRRLKTVVADVREHALGFAPQGLQVALGAAFALLEIQQLLLPGLCLGGREEALLSEALVASQAGFGQLDPTLGSTQFAFGLNHIQLQAAQTVAQGQFSLLELGGLTAAFALQRGLACLDALSDQLGRIALVTAGAQEQHGQQLSRLNPVAFADLDVHDAGRLLGAHSKQPVAGQDQPGDAGFAGVFTPGGEAEQPQCQQHGDHRHQLEAPGLGQPDGAQPLRALCFYGFAPEQRCHGAPPALLRHLGPGPCG